MKFGTLKLGLGSLSSFGSFGSFGSLASFGSFASLESFGLGAWANALANPSPANNTRVVRIRRLEVASMTVLREGKVN